MPGRLRHVVAFLVGGVAGCAAGGATARGGEGVSLAELAAARRDAVAAATVLRAELAARPLGVILAPELELDWLDTELAREPPAADPLSSLERSLRRILPGRSQQPLDTLRHRVGRLARLVRLLEEGEAVAAAARATLDLHLAAPRGGSPVDDDEVRRAFATVAGVAARAADEAAVSRLRERLSVANYAVLVKRDYVAAVSRKQFSQPVEFREQREGAALTGRGRIDVSLSVDSPVSAGENRLVVHAVGTGQIDATADRRRVHVAARAVPAVTGTDQVRLTPERVAVDPPRIQARFTTQVAGLRIDGLLGRCRLVQRIARRTVQEALAANDPGVAREIERTVATRVEEEAATLAYRVNGLLQWGVWDRLAALDFTPEVRLANDESGLRSDTWYAGDDQLGALAARPPIPAATLARLDIVTWAHESAVNNAAAALAGVRLDEATVRGLWEVQCKLWSPDWEALPPARIPTVITLADERPFAVQLVSDGVAVTLRAKACSLAGRPVDQGPREIRLRYRLERDDGGWVFVRDAPDFGGTVPPEKAAAWEEAVGLFFGRSIRPLPRYRPTGMSQHLAIGHLAVQGGWLVVGAARVEPRDDRGGDPR